MTLPTSPSPAAKALDVNDLPIGAFVRWSVDTGFGRGATKQGEVVGKTPKTYKVKGVFLNDDLAVRRDADNLAKRALRVMATPEEWAALKEANIAANQDMQAAHAAKREAQDKADRLRQSQKYAQMVLARRYPDEYTLLVDSFEAAEDAADLFARLDTDAEAEVSAG